MQQAAKGVESAPSQCTAGKQSRLSGNNQALNGGELGSSPEDSGNLPNQYSSPCRWIVRREVHSLDPRNLGLHRADYKMKGFIHAFTWRSVRTALSFVNIVGTQVRSIYPVVRTAFLRTMRWTGYYLTTGAKAACGRLVLSHPAVPCTHDGSVLAGVCAARALGAGADPLGCRSRAVHKSQA